MMKGEDWGMAAGTGIVHARIGSQGAGSGAGYPSAMVENGQIKHQGGRAGGGRGEGGRSGKKTEDIQLDCGPK